MMGRVGSRMDQENSSENCEELGGLVIEYTSKVEG